MEKYIEKTGRSTDDAIAAALAELHLEREEVTVEVLQLPKSGFLGFGSAPAIVRVSYQVPDAPAPVKAEKTERPEKPAKTEKVEKPVKAEKTEKPAKAEKAEKVEKPAKTEKPVKAEKPASPAAAPAVAGEGRNLPRCAPSSKASWSTWASRLRSRSAAAKTAGSA